MKPVMYIFANRALGMSPGKLAAQVAHAAVEAYKLSEQRHAVLVKDWYAKGHAKIVMLAEDSSQLAGIERYLQDRGYALKLIIDEGRTEIKAFSPTALGVEIVDKDDPKVIEHFSHFKTYRELSGAEADSHRKFGRIRAKNW